ncbi:MAG: LysM peptidoglycan-binding domain-containing M23 family metallopeptidase [Myxococcales bacterium]|nr:LysM peptidoglycan-binding domain-containing M23 family metallopeptidase [Myxococcales bacterium]
MGLVLACALSVFDTGCSEPAPPVDAGRPKPAPAPAPAPPPPEPEPSVVHRVEEGQTLWDIARAYGVTVDDIMEANKMRQRDVRRLREGSELKIPGVGQRVEVQTAKDREAQELPPLEDGAYHRLASGESLWTLARTYDVPIETLMERNHLDDDAAGALRIGQALIIPGIKAGQVKEAPPKAREGIHHELAKGETIWDIAYAFRVSVSEIMAANELSADAVTRLRDGTRLFIPGVEEDRRGRVRRKLSKREQRAQRAAQRLGLGTRNVARALLHGKMEKRWRKAADKLGRFPGTLRWPVSQGWFVRGYGSGEQGYHLAMDIMGKIGWNVRAAAPGVVAYSGDEVKGYGNLVVLIHPGGWVTMYAHNSVNFVAAGEQVPRGGIVAEVGSTGISRGPHVHFELIYDGRNCDPAPLLRPGVRHRSGKHGKVTQATWKLGADRPAAVRCDRRRRHPRSRWVIHEDPQAEGGEP